jgi:hypothetical protein
VQFDLSDGFKILVDTPTGRRKSKYLSTSEKMRVGIAMQDVLNGLAPGLGIMIVDDAEALTPDNKIALINTVLNLEDFGTVIVLAARGETEPSDPGVEGLAIFSVSAGQVRRV